MGSGVPLKGSGVPLIGSGVPLKGSGVPLMGPGVPLMGTWGPGVRINGDCLNGVVTWGNWGGGLVVLVVVGTKGLWVTVKGLLVSLIISVLSVSSVVSVSSLRLGLVKNRSDALILGLGVLVVTRGSGTAGSALNVVIGGDWSSDTDSTSPIGS